MCRRWRGRVAEDGLTLIRDEMRRQYADARASYDAALGEAGPIARRIAETGRVVMLGMGASHWANRMVLASYRALGIDAHADVLSDHLRQPLPERPGVTLVVSQSGESGEVGVWLEGQPSRQDRFGLTLNSDSTLGRALPCLAGQGGREKSFAATRSLVVTLALHAAILKHLGHADAAMLSVFDCEPPIPFAPDAQMLAPLMSCQALILCSRGQAHAALEAAALTFMELARAPAMALELGQFLHGPLEALSKRTALLLARPADGEARAVTRMAEAAVSFGLSPVLLDLGPQPPVRGARHVILPPTRGLAAIFILLPAAQTLVIEAAARRVERFGFPRRVTKVMDGEAP